jgi:hypothetical protein
MLHFYIYRLCRRQAEMIHNHEDENVRNIGQGEAPHLKMATDQGRNM